MKSYRQGDVFIIAVAKKPESASELLPRESGRVILAHGEVTGHAHAIKAQGAALFRDPTLAAIFLQVTGDSPVALEHEDHTAIELSPGDYEIRIQSEYSPAEIRRVAD